MLELKNIVKDYYVDKQPFRALKEINLYFPKQQFCSILGPSGCGKTTTLNIIGGLDHYTSGDLLIEGQSTKEYNDKAWDNYRNKRIGFVFQSYNLIPQLSIVENVAMSLTLNGVSRKEKLEKAKVALTKVGLDGMFNKKPNQLSGGQMQRVAIARAIINDPEIILADEPTGALDSTTSIQVMDILKEISKDRLVIMVTHNQDLAYQYSDRIIKFKDGQVESDSCSQEEIQKLKEVEDGAYAEKRDQNIKELTIINEKDKKRKVKKRKEKLSSMSFLTALNLSFKNLLTKKGRTIMTSVAGSFGIIGVALVLAVNNGFSLWIDQMEAETASQMPLTISSYSISYEINENYDQNPEYSDEQFVYPYMSNIGTQTITYNNITPRYIDYLSYLRDETDLMNDYVVNYGDEYAFNLTTEDPITNEAYIVENGTFNSVSNMLYSVTGLPTSYFHVLFGQEEYITESYDIIAGEYPDANDMTELALIVDARNQIPLEVLKELGFYQKDEKFDEEDAQKNPISFDKILNKTYKVYTNDDFYTETTRTDETSNEQITYYEQNDLQTLYEDDTKGIELKISGILRPKQGTNFASMAAGLAYQNSLQEYLVAENQKTNIYTNIKNNIAWKDGAVVKDFISDLTNLMNSENEGMSNTSTSGTQIINELFNKYFDFYSIFKGLSTDSEGNPYTIEDYLSWANMIGADLVDAEMKANGMDLITEYIKQIIMHLSAGTINPDQYKEAYPYVISLLAYINSYSNIQSLIIFPSSLSNKNILMKRLDEWNEIDTTGEDPHRAQNAGEQVHYTDMVGTLTGSLNQLIDILSIVLIVFASISLVVSCVMTGIITYVSVIERTKEIGILRALGARKKDVGRLFEAECVVIGVISGAFGCFIAYIVCFPINAILNAIYPDYGIGNIAALSGSSVIILIAISVLLTFVSSLFPARAAARKDPVAALRSE